MEKWEAAGVGDIYTIFYLQSMAVLREVMIQYDSPVDLELPDRAIDMEKVKMFQWSH